MGAVVGGMQMRRDYSGLQAIPLWLSRMRTKTGLSMLALGALSTTPAGAASPWWAGVLVPVMPIGVEHSSTAA